MLALAACVAGWVVAEAKALEQQTAAPTAPVDGTYFSTEIRPLLEKNCLGCHGVGAKLSNLDLRTREATLRGGTRGTAIVPGKSEKSLLYKLVSGQHAPTMPPTGKLPAAEIVKIKRWIDCGAPWTGQGIDSARKQVWWSFKVPIWPRVPEFKGNAWVRNPIDAFVLAKLNAAGLSPSPPAPRRTLIRRAYLDLIGLPPTPEEVKAFESDRSPNAWEKVVDRLLASPHYGERWGRHWMDLVRYADSGGFEGDKDRPLAWKYRDYIIDSFNKDKPYDRFIREQLAGDEMRSHSIEDVIATGYLACGQQDIVQMNEKTRSDELDDMVTTTGQVFLGLTVGCARCHDHKYDPITTKDYYRLAALFAPTERREIEIPTAEEKQRVVAHNAEVEKELVPLRAKIEPLKKMGEEAAKKAGKAKPSDEEIAKALPESERKSFEELQKQIKTVEAKRLELPKAMAVTDKTTTFPAFHVMIRGDAYHLGQEVQPGFVCSLPGGTTDVGPGWATAQTTGRRSALADWITEPQNPLTARVWMNRVWRQHFGRGIVDTPSNFGISGELPSHPELLDWLALKFESLGWRLKPIHRLMLLSSTYQQSSLIRDDAIKADPQNRWLWRMPVRRLEAEAVRDSILAVAGTLNRQMGGPPVYPPVDPTLRADTFQGPNWHDGKDDSSTWRRSVYVKVKRSLILPELDVYDCPEISASVAVRNITTTPTQALTLLNDPLILHQSALFAERLQKEVGPNPRKQIERAYWLAFSREPTDREISLSLAFLQHRPLTDFCHAVINLNEFVYVP